MDTTSDQDESTIDERACTPPVNLDHVSSPDGSNKRNRKASASRSEPPRAPGSPDNSCAICLGRHDDKSYSNGCYHMFCFTCLLEWSKVKAECPLCKKTFNKILHNIRSYNEFDVHDVPPVVPAVEPRAALQLRTSITWEMMARVRSQNLRYRQRIIDQMRGALYRRPTIPRTPLREATTEFRRHVYQYDLYCEGAQHMHGDNRYRRVTPQFFRSYPACTHRLVPWLNRELLAVLPHPDNVQFVLNFILELIKRVDLRSERFREALRPYTLTHTDHFLHEFYVFATSPLDMVDYDRHARYPPRPATTPTNQWPGIAPSSEPNENPNPTGQANRNEPARRSSGSDSDIDIVSPDAGPSSHSYRPSRQVHPLSYEGRAAFNERQNRTWLRTGLLPRPSHETHDHSAGRENSYASRLAPEEHRPDASMIASRWDSRNDARPVLVAHRLLGAARPEATSISGLINSSDQLLHRVHNFLDSAHHEELGHSSRDVDMPLLSELLGETPPDHAVLESNIITSPAGISSPDRMRERRHSVSPNRQLGERQASASPASSHSSDVIFVHEEKPYKERTPIVLSSDSEEEAPTFEAVKSVRLSRLSASSDETSSSKGGSPHPSAKSTAPVVVMSSSRSSSRSTSRSTSATSPKRRVQDTRVMRGDDDDDKLSDDSECVVTYESKRKSRSPDKKNKEKSYKDVKKQKHKDSDKRKDSTVGSGGKLDVAIGGKQHGDKGRQSEASATSRKVHGHHSRQHKRRRISREYSGEYSADHSRKGSRHKHSDNSRKLSHRNLRSRSRSLIQEGDSRSAGHYRNQKTRSGIMEDIARDRTAANRNSSSRTLGSDCEGGPCGSIAARDGHSQRYAERKASKGSAHSTNDLTDVDGVSNCKSSHSTADPLQGDSVEKQRDKVAQRSSPHSDHSKHSQRCDETPKHWYLDYRRSGFQSNKSHRFQSSRHKGDRNEFIRYFSRGQREQMSEQRDNGGVASPMFKKHNSGHKTSRR